MVWLATFAVSLALVRHRQQRALARDILPAPRKRLN
jgi:hypothetical protein